MTLQEALISLGDNPLSASPYSAAIRALVLAQLGKKGSTITKDTPGYIVLAEVYKIANSAKRDALLERSLGVVRGTDMYKQVVLLMSGLLSFAIIAVALVVVYSDATIDPALTEILKICVQEGFGLIRMVLGIFIGTPTDLTPAA